MLYFFLVCVMCLSSSIHIFFIHIFLWVISPLVYLLLIHANRWLEGSILSAKVLVDIIKWFHGHFVSGSLRINYILLSIHITKWHQDGVKLVHCSLTPPSAPVLCHCSSAVNNKININLGTQLCIQWVLNKSWKLWSKEVKC